MKGAKKIEAATLYIAKKVWEEYTKVLRRTELRWLLFLADKLSFQKYNKTITGKSWRYSYVGVYSEEVANVLLKMSERDMLVSHIDSDKLPKYMKILNNYDYSILTDEEKEILETIAKNFGKWQTKDLMSYIVNFEEVRKAKIGDVVLGNVGEEVNSMEDHVEQKSNGVPSVVFEENDLSSDVIPNAEVSVNVSIEKSSNHNDYVWITFQEIIYIRKNEENKEGTVRLWTEWLFPRDEYKDKKMIMFEKTDEYYLAIFRVLLKIGSVVYLSRVLFPYGDFNKLVYRFEVKNDGLSLIGTRTDTELIGYLTTDQLFEDYFDKER